MTFFRKHIVAVSISSVVLIVALIGSLTLTWPSYSENAEQSLDHDGSIPQTIIPQAFIPQALIPQRVISLAPSVTELIYALGVDSSLIANSRYCKYPTQTDTLPEVGGFLDPNLELIISLNPDLVVLLKEADDLQRKLKKLKIPILTMDHQSIAGVLASYTELGKVMGVVARADSLALAQRNHIANIEKLTAPLNHPKTLISIGHSDKPDVISSVYAAADEGFYSELVRIAGGVNVLTDDDVRYPILGPEAIGALAPEIILDIFPASESDSEFDARFIQNQWKSLNAIPAVRNSRVVVLQGTFFVIPGPRFIEILDEFVIALHPEISEEHLGD